jgi:hypothetical protein
MQLDSPDSVRLGMTLPSDEPLNRSTVTVATTYTRSVTTHSPQSSGHVKRPREQKVGYSVCHQRLDVSPAMPPLASSVPSSALAHRPRHTYENSPVISSTLAKPFQPPLAKRTSVLPARKKRKVTSYAEEAVEQIDTDTSFGVTRVVLGGLDINALKARRRESGEVLRKTFWVPAKENGGMERRIGNAPSLGMLRPANFVPRPLHDPAGEFAIVLYDPTIDDEPTPKIPDGISI